jgi:hypothetical protein
VKRNLKGIEIRKRNMPWVTTERKIQQREKRGWINNHITAWRIIFAMPWLTQLNTNSIELLGMSMKPTTVGDPITGNSEVKPTAATAIATATTT